MICPQDNLPCTGDHSRDCAEMCEGYAAMARRTRQGVQVRQQSEAAHNILLGGRPRVTTRNKDSAEAIAALVVFAFIYAVCLSVSWGISVMIGSSMWPMSVVLFGLFILVRWSLR